MARALTIPGLLSPSGRRLAIPSPLAFFKRHPAIYIIGLALLLTGRLYPGGVVPAHFDMSGWRHRGTCRPGNPKWVKATGVLGCLTAQTPGSTAPGNWGGSGIIAHVMEEYFLGDISRARTLDYYDKNGATLGMPAWVPEVRKPVIDLPDVITMPGGGITHLPGERAHPVPVPWWAVPGVARGGYGGQRWSGTGWAPLWGWGRDRVVTFTPTKPPQVDTKPSDPPTRPDKNTRERKFKVRFNTALRVGYRVINTVTEMLDFVDVLHDALPSDCKVKPVRLRPRSYRSVVGNFRADAQAPYLAEEVERYVRPQKIMRWKTVDGERKRVWTGAYKYNRTHRMPNPAEKLKAVFDCWPHLGEDYMYRAGLGLIREAAEDFVWGMPSQILKHGLYGKPGYVSPVGVEAGPAL